MQIGPSLSLLQALSTQPGAPEPARLKPAADAEASARQQLQVRSEPRWPEPVGGSGRSTAPGPGCPQPSAGTRRVDILV